jgi:hypothetical protein
MSEQPVQELYPGQAADLAAKALRDAAALRANQVPLPGPLSDAFASATKTIHGITLRPIVHSDHIHLQEIGSPILELLLHPRDPSDPSASSTPSTPSAPRFSEKDVAEFIYVLTAPPRAVRALLAQGRQALREAALEATTDRLTSSQISELARAVLDHYLASFSTRAEIEPQKSEEDMAFFLTHDRPRTPDSAGGSATS